MNEKTEPTNIVTIPTRGLTESEIEEFNRANRALTRTCAYHSALCILSAFFLGWTLYSTIRSWMTAPRR